MQSHLSQTTLFFTGVLAVHGEVDEPDNSALINHLSRQWGGSSAALETPIMALRSSTGSAIHQ